MRTASRTQASDGWIRVGLACALLVGLAGGAHRLWPKPASEARAEAAAPRAKAPAVTERARPAARVTPHGLTEGRPLPGSLRGTSEDGALREDERGDLVIGPPVLRLFDY